MTATLADTRLATGTWTIDPAHSEVSFVVRHLMTKVRGKFDSFTGTVTIGNTLADSGVSAEIDVDSISTGQPQRDAHLRSTDFFKSDAKNITFVSTGIVEQGGDYVLSGDLTVNGVTRPVQLELEFLGADTDPYGNTKAGFEAGTSINRKDYGVDFNIPLDGGKLLIGDKVDITLSIQAAKA